VTSWFELVPHAAFVGVVRRVVARQRRVARECCSASS